MSGRNEDVKALVPACFSVFLRRNDECFMI